MSYALADILGTFTLVKRCTTEIVCSVDIVFVVHEL